MLQHERRELIALSPWFWCAVLVAIAIEALLWTWDGSGVTRVRFFFSYPEGYNYIIDDAIVGRFTIQKEDIRYIGQYLSFLRNHAFGISQDWPAQRNLYSLLVSGLWPIGFVAAGALVNLLLWIGATLSAAKMTELVGVTSSLGRGIAVLLVVFHQGFLWSVGETNPHAAGYASGFLLLGAIAYQRALEPESTMRDLIPIAALAGVLCLFYHSALLYLPIVFFVFIRKCLQNRRAAGWGHRQILHRLVMVTILCLLTLGPMLLFSELLTWLGLLNRQSSTAGVLYLRMLPAFISEASGLLSTAVVALLAGFNAFGPLLLVPAAAGVLISMRTGDWRHRYLVFCLVALMLLLVPNFLTGDPGYASVHLTPLVILLAVVGLESIFLFLRRHAARAAVAAALLYTGSLAAYVNAPLIGISFPLNVAWSGYVCLSDCPVWRYRANIYGYQEERF